MGARKFVVMALYPNGCSPMATSRNPNITGCIQTLNNAALLFNTNLKSLVDSLRLQMHGSTLVFVNAYKIIMDILENPIPKGKQFHSFTLYFLARLHLNFLNTIRVLKKEKETN